MRGACLLLLASLVACDDSPFADPADPTPAECMGIQERWSEIATGLDRSCTEDTDCIVIGGSGSCEGGETTIGDCNGMAVSAASFEASLSQLQDASRGWSSCTCDDVECYFDCEEGYARCQAGNCVLQYLSCI